MKISYNWLKDYLDLKVSPEKLAEDLSMFGFTLESLEKIDRDFILDLEVNPNRGDCLSILGMAREVAALYDLKLKAQSSKLKAIEEQLDKDINVQILEPKICPRFSARIIDEIEIAPSSKEIQNRLISFGFRPINNLVDITNYVMLELGQPLHAFDFKKIQQGEMKICQAEGEERLVTLDGQERILPARAVIIRDKEKIYDLAGIMGGANSEVDSNTKTIILQAAIFDPILIRRASKKIGLSTEASFRYERSVDFEGTVKALELAAALIKESSPKSKIGPIIDLQSSKPKEVSLNLDLDKINRLLGTELSLADAQKYLERLNFSTLVFGRLLAVGIPSFRQNEVKTWQDLAEEIARVYGYDKIRSQELRPAVSQRKNKNWQKRETIKDKLKSLGFSEIYSFSFIDQKQGELFGFEPNELIEIANPLSAETQYLRPSLTPGLLRQIAKNPWSPEIIVFETGKVFLNDQEKWQLAMASTGNDSILKDALNQILAQGKIKTIDSQILDFYKIRRGVKLVVCDLEAIKISSQSISSDLPKSKYQEISKYPPTVRDLAFIVDKNIPAEAIRKTIEGISPEIFLVELFDEYASEKFGKDKKNLAFHIWLQDLEGPMAEKEVEEIIQKIIKNIKSKFKAELRNY